MREICICAAVKTTCGKIFRGHRHSDCMRTIREARLVPDDLMESQGFITSRNRFVNRKIGYRLQVRAGIESINKTGYWREELYSEDLY